MEQSTIRWLHISDLHVGCSGPALWVEVQDQFLRQLPAVLKGCGGVDVVLITGDLANTGAEAEYVALGGFLARLRGVVGAGVPVLAVPGNHDLERPTSVRELRDYAWLRAYRDHEHSAQFRKALWGGDRDLVAPLFRHYETWWRDATPSAGLEIHHSLIMPGDFSAVLTKGALRLGIVGLNSAFAQCTGGDFDGRIHLEREQLHKALPGKDDDKLSFFGGVTKSLLLMHHPPSWLHVDAKADFDGSIFNPDWFTAVLHGHMHTGGSESLGATRQLVQDRLQAPSLFGVEHYQEASRESREHGFFIGELRQDGRTRLRAWEGTVLHGGAWGFVPTYKLAAPEPDQWIVIAPGTPAATPQGAAGTATPVVAAPTPEAPVVERYRAWARGRYAKLSMVGVGADDLHFRIEDVYVGLQAQRVAVRHRRRGRHRPMGPDAELLELPFEDVFRDAGEGQGIVIVGQAGAGKTTILRRIAHDVLAGRATELGLDRGTVPVLVRARTLAAMPGCTVEQAIQAEADQQTGGEYPGLGGSLCDRRKLLLLVDGLDEVAEASGRAAVARWLEQKLDVMCGGQGRIVASTRYDGYTGEAELSGAFTRFDVRPLGRVQQEELVRRWLGEAYRVKLGPSREREATTQAEAAAERIVGRLDTLDLYLSSMLSTPLLLTLVCVVVYRGHDMPRRRAEFFEQCLRVLLEQWRRCRDGSKAEAVEPAPLDFTAVKPLLARLAWHLQKDGRKDDLTEAELDGLWSGSLERLRAQARGTTTTTEVLQWLVRDAAVLEEFGDDRYGFSHLQLQEYLTAEYLTPADGPGLDELAERLHDKKWREIVLLAVGLPKRGVFAGLARRVLKQPEWLNDGYAWGMLRACVAEANDADLTPFVEILLTAGGGRKAEILGLVAGREDPALIAAARALADVDDPTLKAAARRAAGMAPEPSRATPEREAVAGIPPTPAIVTTDGHRIEPGEPYTCPVSGVRFLWVPEGRFEMGADEVGKRAQPVHPVRVTGFWLGETTVTNAQYQRLVDSVPGTARPAMWSDRRFAEPDQPVVAVSWHDAMAYCAWLRGRTGLPAVLPSEAQWERAARGDDGRRYPWGDSSPDESRAWFGQQFGAEPKPVGLFPAGRGLFGHVDLAGNVFEWCLDEWVEDAYQEAEHQEGPVDPVIDPGAKRAGNATGGRGIGGARVLRGACCWAELVGGLRSADRSWNGAFWRDDYCGFRVALSPGSRLLR